MARLSQPTWMRKLDVLLRNLGLPVREMVAGDGLLGIQFVRQQGPPLEMQIRPLRPEMQGWANTNRYVVGYAGAQALSAQDEKVLRRVLKILRHIERHLPERFDEPAGIFGDDLTDEQRFLRLFPFCAVEHSMLHGEPFAEVLIRTTPRCNQACPFCSAPTHEQPPLSAVLASIEEADRIFPGGGLTLTGGEPTLRPTFIEELNLAVAQPNARRVHIQTNAVAFAKKIDPSKISPRDHLFFFVSLHALDDAIYNECTGTVGQAPLARDGIRKLIETGHGVTLNCVVGSANVSHLPDLVRGIPQAVGMSERVELHFSSLICPEQRERAPDFLVPYEELAPAVEQARELATSLGMQVQALRPSTHASIPACFLSNPLQSAPPGRKMALSTSETGYEDFSKDWIKASRCRDCVFTASCLGVPNPYAKKFGLDGLQPINQEHPSEKEINDIQ